MKHAASTNTPFGRGSLKSWRALDCVIKQAPHDRAAKRPQSDPAEFCTVASVHGGYVLTFHGLAQFQIDFGQRTITPFDCAPATTEADLDHLLFDHIAPRILAHEGQLILHASAVDMGGEAVIFLGDTGAGKSTLAASLHRAGHRLLGDDAVIVSRTGTQAQAEPVYPSLRLYPDTIAALIDDATSLAPMAHYSDKQRVALPHLSDTTAAPLPIASIFFLSGDRHAKDPQARSLSPSQICIKLLEQSFALDPMDVQRAAGRMAMASQLTQSVPAYEIDVAHDYDRLVELHALIAACIEQGRQRAD